MSVFARESATLPARDVSEKYVCTADSSDSAAKKRKKKKRRRKKTKLARERRGRRRKKKKKRSRGGKWQERREGGGGGGKSKRGKRNGREARSVRGCIYPRLGFTLPRFTKGAIHRTPMNEHGRTRAMPTLYAGNATGRSGCRTKTRRKRAPVLLSSFCLSSPEMFRTERRRERGGGGERERERKVGRKTTRYTHVHTPIHPSCSRRIISFDIDRVIDLESVFHSLDLS